MLNDTALDTLFYAARTHNGWQDREVTNAQLEHLFDLLKWGADGRQRLAGALRVRQIAGGARASWRPASRPATRPRWRRRR